MGRYYLFLVANPRIVNAIHKQRIPNPSQANGCTNIQNNITKNQIPINPIPANHKSSDVIVI